MMKQKHIRSYSISILALQVPLAKSEQDCSYFHEVQKEAAINELNTE